MQNKDVTSIQTLYKSIDEARKAGDLERLTELRRDLRVLSAYAEESESRLMEAEGA